MERRHLRWISNSFVQVMSLGFWQNRWGRFLGEDGLPQHSQKDMRHINIIFSFSFKNLIFHLNYFKKKFGSPGGLIK